MKIKLYEYEGKEIFAQNGLIIPKSVFVKKGAAYEGIDNLCYPCLVKAQILQGGRGKAGGVKAAETPEAARQIGQALMAKPLKNEMPAGVLIEEMADVAKEMYLGITIDDVRGAPILVFAPDSGGMEIESIAQNHPEKLYKQHLEPDRRLYLYQAAHICRNLGFSGELAAKIARIIVDLEAIFHKTDANLVEINPLLITKTGEALAADAKIIIDDYAAFRHKYLAPRQEAATLDDAFEQRARDNDYILVRLGGDVAVISLGAGFGMAIVDTIDYCGGRAANFVDQMGGKSVLPSVKGVLQMIQEDPAVKSAVWGFVLSASSLADAIGSTREALQAYPCRVPVHGYFRAGSAALRDIDTKTAWQQMTALGITMHKSLKEAVAAAVAEEVDKA